jgi:hypothetical protein
MSVNEYVTKFTQLSRYALHEIDTNEKKQECFLNGLNDGLAYALEAQDFENFQGMVNKALMLENHNGVIEHKHKLVHQHQPSSSSRPHVATSSAAVSVKAIGSWTRILYPAASSDSAPPTTSRLLLLGIRVFREPKLPKTHNKLIVGAITVVNRDITTIDAPIRALMSISSLQLHLPLPVEPTMFLLLPSRLRPWESQSCGY